MVSSSPALLSKPFDPAFFPSLQPICKTYTMLLEIAGSQDGHSKQPSFLIHLLPYELLLKILDMLDFRALVVCTQVCHHIRSIVSKASSLQYTIELGVNGMENGPSGGLNHSDRLKRLLEYEKAWVDLKWTSDTIIPMVSGSTIWELAGGVLAQSASSRDSLLFTQLPSKLRNIEQKRWGLDISRFKVRDFTMDPSQDLLVLVGRAHTIPHARHPRSEHGIKLLRMSTGALHNAAAMPELVSNVPMSGEGVSLVIRPCGDYVAILFKHPGQRRCALRVWNWKTGRVQLALSGAGLRSFGFLDEKRIIVATHIDLATKGLQPNLVIYDFSQASDEMLALENSSYLCAFMLPLPGDWTVRLDIEIQADPTPSFVPDAALSVPFFASREGRMNVVTLVLTNGIEIQSFAFMVPSSTLSKHIACLPAGQGHILSWHEWGPDGSRMIFEPQHSNTWVCHVYGLRYTTPDDMIDDDGATSISVYDFNPLPIRRANSAPSEQDHVTEASTIDTDGVFEEPVTTSLPYRLSKVGWGPEEGATDFGRFGSVMCSEDSLVVVGAGHEHGHYRVLSF